MYYSPMYLFRIFSKYRGEETFEKMFHFIDISNKYCIVDSIKLEKETKIQFSEKKTKYLQKKKSYANQLFHYNLCS